MKPTKTLRCRACNCILQGVGYFHICPKRLKVIWKTKVNTSHGRTERRQRRLDYMIKHPKFFKNKTTTIFK